MIYLDNIGVIRNKEEILANFNYLFEDKRIYGISGTNTQSRTLLEIIAGIYKLNSGKCLYDDLKKADLGYVCFGHMLVLSQTIEDNLKFILEMSEIKYDRNKAKEVLAMLDVDLDLDMQIAKLSDGQKTIIEFIIPYLKNSKVILLDCLDVAGPEYQFILNNLKKLYANKLCIITSSSLNELNFDDVLYLNSGERKTFSKPTNISNIKEKTSLKALLSAFKGFFLNKKNYLLGMALLFSFILSMLNIVFSNKFYSFDNLSEKMAKNNDLMPIIIEGDVKDITLSNIKYRNTIELDNTRIEGMSLRYNGKYNVFNYYVYDDSLGDNEIKITSLVADELILRGVLPSSDYQSLIGKELTISHTYTYDANWERLYLDSSKYKIKDIVVFDDESDEASRTLYGNKNTYFDLFKLCIRGQHVNLNETEFFEVNGMPYLAIDYRTDYNLEFNELCVGKQARKFLQNQGYNPVDGKTITLNLLPSKLAVGDTSNLEKLSYTFKVKFDDSVDELQISSETQNTLLRLSFPKYFGFKNDYYDSYYDEYDSYYYDDFSNCMLFYQEIKQAGIYKDNLIYTNANTINSILTNSFRNDFENIALFLVSIGLVLLTSILVVYHTLHKEKDYQYLTSLGLSLKGRYLLGIFENLIMVGIAYIGANIIDIAYFSIKGAYIKAKYNINSFIIGYNFPFSLIVLIIIIIYATLLSIVVTKAKSKRVWLE